MPTHPGSPAVTRLIVTGLAMKPVVKRGRSNGKKSVVIKAEGLTLACRGAKILENGTA